MSHESWLESTEHIWELVVKFLSGRQNNAHIPPPPLNTFTSQPLEPEKVLCYKTKGIKVAEEVKLLISKP